MLKVYYCENCKKTMFISREIDTTCRRCSVPMKKLHISYEDFGQLNAEERDALIKKEMMQADLVVLGTIFTGEGTVKEAMAIKDGKIFYVGNKKDIQVMIGEKTKVIEPKGLVLPAFTEGHAHVTSTYEVYWGAVLYEGESKDDYVQIFKEYLKEHPETTFLMGRGFRNGVFEEPGPQAWMLDEVSKEIPIAAIGEDAHSLWVNTKALEMAGIGRNTKDVPGGVVVRYEDGRPTGWFKEAADYLMQPILPVFQLDKLKEVILHYQKLALDNGILHVFEPMLNPQREYDVCVRAYEELAKEEKLILDYQVGYTIYPTEDIDERLNQIMEYRARAQEIGNEHYKLNTIKLFIDGVLECHTAFLREPYEDCPDTCGEPLWTQERLNEVVAKAEANGFQVHMHTIGDGAIGMAIEAFKTVKETAGNTDTSMTAKAGREVDGDFDKNGHAPHIITHVQVVGEKQFKQLAELEITIVVNPYWHIKDPVYFDELEEPYIGTKRAENEYPVASFLNAGCVVSQASDFPVTYPAELMMSLHNMVNREHPKFDTKEPLNPKEAISVEQALAVMTINGAKQLGLEGVTGSLKEGKHADFVILDKNLLTIEPSQLYTAKVQQIYRKGCCVKK